MKSKKFVWYIFSLIVLILVIYSISYFVSKKSNTNLKTETNKVTYFCKEGILKAKYQKDNVTLLFKDVKNLTLPQTFSGSGIRYEFGTTTFVSKGGFAFLTEGDKQTYTNCVSGQEIKNMGINTYTDSSKTFSFSYPEQFILSGGDIGYSQDWSVGTDKLGQLLTVLDIPRTLMPKTNFAGSKFTVGRSADPDAVKNCLVYNYGGMGTTSEATIGERKFTKMTFTDAGAGNFYETTSYKTIYNEQCYVIEYNIHSTNIYNYSPDQGIKSFDKAKIVHILEGIVESFSFSK